MMYGYEYNNYVQKSEDLGNDIMSYEEWKESQGYRNEYDSDNITEKERQILQGTKIHFNTFEELKTYWRANKDNIISKGQDPQYYVVIK